MNSNLHVCERVRDIHMYSTWCLSCVRGFVLSYVHFVVSDVCKRVRDIRMYSLRCLTKFSLRVQLHGWCERVCIHLSLRVCVQIYVCI